MKEMGWIALIDLVSVVQVAQHVNDRMVRIQIPFDYQEQNLDLHSVISYQSYYRHHPIIIESIPSQRMKGFM